VKTLRYTNTSANAIAAITTFGSSVVQTIGERISSRRILFAGALLLAAATAVAMPEGLMSAAQSVARVAVQTLTSLSMPVMMIGGTAAIGALFGGIGGVIVRLRERRWE
jgi:hypothetical protein